VFYVVPTLATLLPPPVGEKVMPFLPSNAVGGGVQGHGGRPDRLVPEAR
jgi:hypothetical protein